MSTFSGHAVLQQEITRLRARITRLEEQLRTRDASLPDNGPPAARPAEQDSGRAFRQSEEWLRVTLRSIGDAVVATDKDGRIDYLNPAAAELAGWEHSQALGRPIRHVFRMVDERTGEEIEDIVARVLRERCAVALPNHTVLVTREGRAVPVQDSAAPIRDSAGDVAGVVLVFQDVSEKRRADEALRESEQRVRLKLDSILSPDGDIGRLELADIIDSAALQSLVEDFYTLARIPVSVIDLQGNVLVGVGWQDICTRFHRAHPDACQNCIESDTHLSAGVPAGECRLYKCKNNMWDIASPIIVGGRHAGNLFSGQFFFDDEPVDYELFRSQARQYGFEEAEYLSALQKVPRLSRDAVNVGMAFFIKLGHMLSLLSYSNIKLARLLSQRDALTASLRESGEMLNRAEHIASLGSWKLDLVENRLSWSDEVYRIFGLQPRQFTATYEAFLEAVHSEDRDAVNTAYLDSLREGKDSYEITHRIVRRDSGEVRWVHEKCEHVRDEAGRIARSVGMVQDITGRRRAEERIHHQNAVLGAINQVFGQAFGSGSEEELARISLKIAEQLTESKFGVIGHAVADGGLGDFVFTDAVQRVSRTDLTAVYRRLLDEGKAFYTNEPASAPEAGASEWDPPLPPLLAVPLLHDGTTIGVIAVAKREGGYRREDLEALEALGLAIVQVLMRRRAERALRDSEARERAKAAELEAIMHAVPAATFVARDSGCHEIVGNRLTYQLLRLPPGTNLSKSAAPDAQPATFRLMRDGTEIPPSELPIQVVTRTGRPVSDVALDVVHGDGSSHQLFGNAVPLLDAQGRACGGVGAFIDVTELKRVEAQLRHAHKLESIGLLAGGVAHDFNNILTSILGNATLLQLEAPPGMNRRLETIVQSSEKAASLTRQLLAYAGKGRFHITDFNVSELVRSSAELIRVSIPKNVDVDLDIPPNLPAIRGDSSQIQQVLMNLVINAAEAIGDGKPGRVSVGACVRDFDASCALRSRIEPGSYICITVRDDGCGMDEDTKAKIFDPFFTTKFTGRGLGLAAVQGILRSHKGAITVDTNLGHGSTFTVYLPCSGRRSVAAAPAAVPGNTRIAATVLVVDDEASVRDLSEAVLARLGYRVLLAENGRQALEVLHENNDIQLVLLDLLMPVMGGAEAFAEIRKERPELPVVVASGYSRQEAHRLGLPADLPIVEKPYTAQRLSTAIETALSSPPRQRSM